LPGPNPPRRALHAQARCSNAPRSPAFSTTKASGSGRNCVRNKPSPWSANPPTVSIEMRCASTEMATSSATCRACRNGGEPDARPRRNARRPHRGIARGRSAVAEDGGGGVAVTRARTSAFLQIQPTIWRDGPLTQVATHPIIAVQNIFCSVFVEEYMLESSILLNAFSIRGFCPGLIEYSAWGWSFAPAALHRKTVGHLRMVTRYRIMAWHTVDDE